MKHHRIEVPAGIGGDGEGCARRGADYREAGGELGDPVAVAHPDFLAPRGEEPGEERVCRLGGGDVGAPELGGMPAFYAATELDHHSLLAIADAEDRNAELEDFGRGARAARIKHRRRSTGQDDRPRREFGDERRIDLLIGVDLAVDPRLAQAAGDQLGDLTAEIDDEQALVIGLVRHGEAIGGRAAACKTCRPEFSRSAPRLSLGAQHPPEHVGIEQGLLEKRAGDVQEDHVHQHRLQQLVNAARLGNAAEPGRKAG